MTAHALSPDLFAAALTLWDFHNAVAPPPDGARFDAVVGLGSYDDSVARHAAELVLADRAPWLVFSGREGNWTAGEFGDTEAARFAAVARREGVPADRILLEPTATNLGANVVASEALLRGRGLSRTLWVTKPQTRLRLALTLRRQTTLVDWSVTAPSRSLSQALDLFGAERILEEMVGDFDRVLAYPARGLQAEAEVPEAVHAAAAVVAGAGYNRHRL
ncbi:ElyC/SanA/YdcF family protein [Mangrovibrevibacter kandeliae]|uniref:ElyC/SanA/YdcF family protein n=1 Tax=Mangrovibrevibacter kandeliae TaxID=2968473 RepID=UPI00211731A7|nr:ElyC/SanA/YdcF family protein [Aurantimonas sp. CSK15Z-1]MCQ8781462.1 YdcF family protein [Aurantimonas sp. CSK15Z-1]